MMSRLTIGDDCACMSLVSSFSRMRLSAESLGLSSVPLASFVLLVATIAHILFSYRLLCDLFDDPLPHQCMTKTLAGLQWVTLIEQTTGYVYSRRKQKGSAHVPFLQGEPKDSE